MFGNVILRMEVCPTNIALADGVTFPLGEISMQLDEYNKKVPDNEVATGQICQAFNESCGKVGGKRRMRRGGWKRLARAGTIERATASASRFAHLLNSTAVEDNQLPPAMLGDRGLAEAFAAGEAARKGAVAPASISAAQLDNLKMMMQGYGDRVEAAATPEIKAESKELAAAFKMVEAEFEEEESFKRQKMLGEEDMEQGGGGIDDVIQQLEVEIESIKNDLRDKDTRLKRGDLSKEDNTELELSIAEARVSLRQKEKALETRRSIKAGTYKVCTAFKACVLAGAVGASWTLLYKLAFAGGYLGIVSMMKSLNNGAASMWRGIQSIFVMGINMKSKKVFEEGWKWWSTISGLKDADQAVGRVGYGTAEGNMRTQLWKALVTLCNLMPGTDDLAKWKDQALNKMKRAEVEESAPAEPLVVSCGVQAAPVSMVEVGSGEEGPIGSQSGGRRRASRRRASRRRASRRRATRRRASHRRGGKRSSKNVKKHKTRGKRVIKKNRTRRARK